MTASFIVAAKRSAVVPRAGAFRALPLHALAADVMRDVLSASGLPASAVKEVILSNALGAGGNPARVAALAAGIPEAVAGLSIDRQCAGGLDAILLGDAMIRSGLCDMVIAGGAESYSRRPIRMRTHVDGSTPTPYDQAQFTPWPDRDPDMAEAADHLAQRLTISRSQQDLWAIESHRKARAAATDMEAEITPIEGQISDPFARKLSAALCARARGVHGSITGANMAVAADGAAFVVMVSDAVRQQINRPALRVVAGQTLGGDPTLPGLAPVAAIEATLSKAKTKLSAVATAEIMEAFAVQAIACQQGAGLAPEIINPKGGALARGHPIGASGAVLAVRLFYDLIGTQQMGLAAIAAAGGLGSALLVTPD